MNERLHGDVVKLNNRVKQLQREELLSHFMKLILKSILQDDDLFANKINSQYIT